MTILAVKKRFSKCCQAPWSMYATLPHMFTGERILPGGKFNVTYQESLFAYDFARQRARGKRVLDVGSGEGYGVAYLAERAAEVVGLDMNQGAITQAQQKYLGSNIRFVTELAEEKFDIVCCFQTIEHVHDQDQFLDQLKQFAKPGGTVLVTTPNKGRFSGFNPYHIRELTPADLQELMQAHFLESRVLGIFGNEAVLQYRNSKQRISNAILKIDVLRAREWLPRPVVLVLYGMGTGIVKTLSRKAEPQADQAVDLESFWVSDKNISQALDLLAVGKVE